jgi:hypothetical protein
MLLLLLQKHTGCMSVHHLLCACFRNVTHVAHNSMLLLQQQQGPRWRCWHAAAVANTALAAQTTAAGPSAAAVALLLCA